ncbi:hypothetical protein GALMADRAFT_143116 [Galerina marginata CBS 339.88]|uniref:DUF6534 domain-containing protein n=1 Tax=Galerina marginata (strain CBS 339.88) TaxID=685588 RepID=A0A067SZQ7_GALM3|nr:hypothetical protein GALMADRAFT_143116 [Galerina marginata CBS 339.88]
MDLASSTLPQIPADVASKTGPRIIGILFHWGLFGVLCTQVYLYHLAFPKDPLRNKIFVYLVFLLEVLQTVIITISAWNVFGSGYGDFSVYNRVALAWFSVPVISGVVAFLAEAFYAYRITVLAQSYWMAGIILALAFVQLGGSFASAWALKNAVFFSRLLGRDFFISAGIWNGGSALCDVIIAVCMTYYLSRRGTGGMLNTQVFLRKVIRLVIETGTVTAAIAILNLILALLPSRPAYYQIPSEVLAKVYSNSMMVMLNSRMRIGLDTSSSVEVPLSRHRHDLTITNRGTDAFELGEGIMITREELVFPSRTESDKEDERRSSKGVGYVV